MTSAKAFRRLILATTTSLCLLPAVASAQQRPCIGNSGPVTGAAAFGGQVIKIGAEIAIDEINAKGGVLGQKLSFIQYDDAGAPPRGVDNTRRIALADKCIAILGGYHSTVALAQVQPVNEMGIPYVGVIAGNTKVIENGAEKNFMFRVSAKDKWVAQFLVDQAVKASKTGKIGFLYENTGWGNGAVPDVQAAIQKAGKQLVASETFNWNDQDMTPQAIRLRDAGADTLVVFALDREGNQIIRSFNKINYNPAMFSAWGLAGNFGELAGPLANGVRVFQTYTFMGEQDAKTKALWEKIKAKYGMKDPSEIKMGSGVANSYDAVHILAKAIEKAGSYDWAKVREALYKVEHEGIVGSYKPAFDASNPERQDAILLRDYKLTAWHDGKLLPIAQTPYGR
jgi:branched-chain amino acid transport system substrate-binding protein